MCFSEISSMLLSRDNRDDFENGDDLLWRFITPALRSFLCVIKINIYLKYVKIIIYFLNDASFKINYNVHHICIIKKAVIQN